MDPSQIFIDQLLEKTNQNKDLALILFTKLFTELSEQIAMIEQTLTSSYLTLAKEVTHKLHGSVSFCGFIDLQYAANQLETDLSDNNLKKALVSFQQLKQEIEHFVGLKDEILQHL